KFDRVKWVLTMALSLVLFLFVFLVIHEVLEGRAITERQRLVSETARSLAHKRYFSMLTDKGHAKILDAVDQNPDEMEKKLDAVPPDRTVCEIEKLYRKSADVLQKKYGYRPGQTRGTRPERPAHAPHH